VESVKEYLAKIGRKGGKARLTKMTPAERKKVAKAGSAARWSKQKKEKSA
jgi:hypothetical protein